MVEPKRRLRNSRISETPGGLIGSSPLYRTTTESTPAGGTAPARLPLRGRPIWHSGARMTSPPTTPVLLGPGLADGEAQWDWWNHWSMQGTKRRWAPRIPQRDHENPALRPPAVRALILYPLNALVEDQLGRLGDGFDGTQARAWLQAQRGGNRLYFGRYTARTPVSGKPNDPAARDRLRTELQARRSRTSSGCYSPPRAGPALSPRS
jgi:hypothetical protein